MNTQPIEKQNLRVDGSLEVHHVWYTIQGEGPYAGTPAVFVRLTGCNLTCGFCDTEYTSCRILVKPDDLLWGEVGRVLSEAGSPKCNLIVLTGGEPLRQNIMPFAVNAGADGFNVQVETNGTLFLEDLAARPPRLMIVCSPKAQIHPKLHDYIHSYKYVVQEGQVDERDGLPLRTLGNTCSVGRPQNHRADVYVQPLDEQNEERNKLNLKAAVASCMKFGHRLCLQTHKIASLE